MTYYYRLGKIPPKRHTQFRKEDGSLYHEELVSSLGFSGIYSNIYHKIPPTKVKAIGERIPYGYTLDKEHGLKMAHLKTSEVYVTGQSFMDARVPLMANNQTIISICYPENLQSDSYFKNADGDELIYCYEGMGEMLSQFGLLPFKKGDYIVIPRTTIYKLKSLEKCKFLIVESKAPIETVGRYRNELGQLLEHSPYCERDLHPPTHLPKSNKHEEYKIFIKKDDYLNTYVYEHDPLDVIGWDGFLYPYTFSIYDFEPITGRIHQPPPVHQTFQARGAFVVCSFVPRLFDYHPKSIPAPYNHSNIDSDEVLFYTEGEFMSRKGIKQGAFTLHPGGIPHGPHPGTVEKSIGKKGTEEYAVMIDTFSSLYITEKAKEYLDKEYPYSWNDE
ncbi:homogentisate 1,2-dioxygenase [Flammeovirga kamogawensis]|uniref:Homogentisate 1,2-dioxygenase n=1 Tax=Flammeovirga kamogawensis TaxID=373891 RepID=A0ABX8GWD7_9BACT|nr:homogentisate 1,2-dioxygenase [Flammeovirga kamogawensis]MBB6460554.1 homogentisate 1,2-dioxygenase [Flammeovirga kamogawensis]QWG07914.1 homogentisate 1,2-dioxygenase [Flammeovirga kamogawensis]TRX69721.1 homogentisate 1,2-dioxygenase [Flammeovirga kamogawensis]